jgi:hypothetical protein
MQKRIVENIFLTLENLRSGKETSKDLSLIFQASYNITKVYLGKNQRKFGFLNNREDYEIDDAVMEIITPLFLTRNGRKYDRLLAAYEKWEPPIKTNSDALFFLHQLIFIRAEHYLTKALEKVDPLYSKILRDINTKIIQSGLYKVRFMGHCFISESESINPDQRIIDKDGVENLPVELLKSEDYLLDLLNYLKAETNFSPAIPLNELVLRIKKLNIPRFEEVQSEKIIEESLYTEELISSSLDVSLMKLFQSYVNKNKLTDGEAKLLSKLLQDIANDMKEGGLNIGLYEYVKKYQPEMSRDNYKYKYDDILEYLVKIMKQTAKELLEKDI